MRGALLAILSVIVLAACDDARTVDSEKSAQPQAKPTRNTTQPAKIGPEERGRLVDKALENRAWIGLTKKQLEKKLTTLGFGPDFKYQKGTALDRMMVTVTKPQDQPDAKNQPEKGEKATPDTPKPPDRPNAKDRPETSILDALAAAAGSAEVGDGQHQPTSDLEELLIELAPTQVVSTEGSKKKTGQARTQLRIVLKNGRVTEAGMLVILIDKSPSMTLIVGANGSWKQAMSEVLKADAAQVRKRNAAIREAVAKKEWIGLNKKQVEERLGQLGLGPGFTYDKPSGITPDGVDEELVRQIWPASVMFEKYGLVQFKYGNATTDKSEHLRVQFKNGKVKGASVVVQDASAPAEKP